MLDMYGEILCTTAPSNNRPCVPSPSQFYTKLEPDTFRVQACTQTSAFRPLRP